MANKLGDTLVVAAKMNDLKKQNKKLLKELEAAKKVLFRIDTQREGLKLFARHLKKAWGPLDPVEAKECGDEQVKIKRFDEKFLSVLKEVAQDPVFKEEHEKRINSEINQHVTSMMSHEERMELEHQEKVIRQRHEAARLAYGDPSQASPTPSRKKS